MESCGYNLLANGTTIESNICLTEKFTIEIRDGYKLEIIHPTLESAKESNITEKWSVEGEHTIAINESSP